MTLPIATFLSLLTITATADEPTHWAFVAPSRPAVPEVRDGKWVRNPIDAFILAGLEEFDLRPTPEADRPTLLRRLTIDLTGLPPTPEELDAFLVDDRPDAYERVVDRLLATPRYGERWAQHWLDLARYADTDGFEFDQARPDAWRYRDWVVKALNEDTPYDRFVALQLAGDELAPGEPDALVATGFNRCYPDMVDMNDQDERRQHALDDVTETAGLAFLGLTIGCARCHDHKFDPIRQEEFYRLQAVFTPARFRDDLALATRDERADYERRRDEWRSTLASSQADLIALEAPARERLSPGPPPGLNDEAAAAWRADPADRTPTQVALVFDAIPDDRRVKLGDLIEAIGPEAAGRRRELLNGIAAHRRREPPAPPQARGLDEAGPDAAPTFVMIRGEFGRRGAEVTPGVPSALVATGASTDLTAEASARSTGRRTALARWLTDPANPLTARVMVNRLWQHHYGRGLVATPSDFGTQGEPPSHPELLDWLATELVARGWSPKAMHRLMVTSATYRQGSTAADPRTVEDDPENLLLGRQNRQRLDGETIRDALLFVSGRLDPGAGGPGVFPDLPAELAKLSGKGAAWPVSAREEDRRRRSLYVFVRRNLRYPFFEAFDRPDTNASCARRPVTTIAPQSLALLNGRAAHDAAKAMAERIGAEAGASPEARVGRAYRLAIGRAPDDRERALAVGFLADEPGGGLAGLCLALLNTNEFVYVD